MENYRWIKRTPEWIKENPGKGTMYKEFYKGELPPRTIKVNNSAYKKKVVEEVFRYSKKENVVEDIKAKKGYDAGIYVIICEKAKSAYVGQSINVGVRLRNHKMLIQNKYDAESHYDQMRLDYKKHGADSLEYKKHVSLPFSTTSQLLEKEQSVMWEFVEAGYKLYNRAINIGRECISCPDNLKPTIIGLIGLCKKDATVITKIELFIQQGHK